MLFLPRMGLFLLLFGILWFKIIVQEHICVSDFVASEADGFFTDFPKGESCSFETLICSKILHAATRSSIHCQRDQNSHRGSISLLF